MTPSELAELHARCFTVPRPFRAEEFADLLGAPASFLCAEPAGFAVGRAIAGEAELITLAVDPDQRRQGAGRRLVAAFLAGARHRGATMALLEVDARNSAAHALYRQTGFVEVGRRPAYYRHADGASDALVLRCDL